MSRGDNLISYWKGKKRKPFSEEHKKKLSESHIGQVGYWTGKKRKSLSEETKKKISNSQLGKSKQKHPHKQETKERISKSLIGRKKSIEMRKKLGESRRGSNSTFWIDGRAQYNRSARLIFMDTFVYKEWRKTVFERDDFICQICSKRSNNLNANHIKRFSDYPDLRVEILNGITLCKECHIGLVNNHESEWESYFNFNLMTRGFLPDNNWKVVS